MKLGPDMYNLNTFRLPKKEGVNGWAGEEHIKRNTKRCHEINNILTLTLPNNTLQNPINVKNFLL